MTIHVFHVRKAIKTEICLKRSVKKEGKQIESQILGRAWKKCVQACSNWTWYWHSTTREHIHTSVHAHTVTHIRHVNVSLLIRFYSTCVSPYPLIGFTFTEGLSQHGNNQTQQSPQQWNRTYILRLLICSYSSFDLNNFDNSCTRFDLKT